MLGLGWQAIEKLATKKQLGDEVVTSDNASADYANAESASAEGDHAEHSTADSVVIRRIAYCGVLVFATAGALASIASYIA